MQDKIEELLGRVQRPGRYLGNEWNAVTKDLDKACVKFALCFPDLYEIGMSHLGFKLIYHLLNEKKDIACERVFSPAADLERILRNESLPLFTLESKKRLAAFDVIGFSLSYELNYTNMLNILDLAGIPLLAKDRGERHPLIIAGGPSTCNPEPISDFIDFFVIGEAEESLPEALDIVKSYKKRRDLDRTEFLKEICRIDGIYVPSLYKAEYNNNGTLKSFNPIFKDAPLTINKRSIGNLETSFYPTKQIVPHISIVHDRVSVEIMRGCPNLCRFCQARVLYYHRRECSLDRILKLAEESIKETGYEEISLLSLSSGNHSQIVRIISFLIDKFKRKGINVSLPSLRIDEVLKELPGILSRVKKSGLTFAPEAGSERLRRVMNKHIDIKELESAVEAAAGSGWRSVKLYFMIGLPTETHEDIDGIVDIVQRLLHKNRNLHINVSIASFIPKPHTPFQWARMETREALNDKFRYIKERIKTKRAKLKFNNTNISVLEGVLSRGDRRLNAVILRAFNKGCRLEGWLEHLDSDKWLEAFKEEGIDPDFYLYREKEYGETLPWDHINFGITKEYMVEEARKAGESEG